MGSVSLNILNRYFSNSWILFLAIVLSAMAGLWLLMVEMTVFNLLLAFTVLTIAQGLSFPISIALLLGPHKTQAGSVSALSGSIQMVIAGVFGGFLVEYWVTSQVSLGRFYLFSALLMAAVLLVSQIRRYSVDAQAVDTQ
ncbi:multidrug resistance protein D [Vibrio maritimus]|uniref:Multidrug resistance protein D n=1 Tax=Vibrio maritimus TaxID=990268 RepID=A0A090TBS6_9VIBR|nr:multidrug resistance protein D [Vibrio maritimus]